MRFDPNFSDRGIQKSAVRPHFLQTEVFRKVRFDPTF